MLTRKEILEKLQDLNKYKEQFVVISGASLVMQKVKTKTEDVDIAVTKELYEILKKDSVYVKTFNEVDVYSYDGIEFSTNFYDKENAILIDGFYFQKVLDILKLKKELNRDKDKKDIKKIELYLALQDTKKYEKELYQKGIKYICGVDEVGRGPLVGPVVAAAVILPIDYNLDGLTDSKKLSEKKREEYFDIIMHDAISVGVGIIDEKKIDEVNIYEATKLAMYEAINNLNVKPEHVLIDAMKLDLDVESTSIIKGDLKSISISAASVIAKVTRDRMLDELHELYPYYNFKKNKGYPTKEHIKAIEEHGIIKEHRRSYSPVKEYVESM